MSRYCLITRIIVIQSCFLLFSCAIKDNHFPLVFYSETMQDSLEAFIQEAADRKAEKDIQLITIVQLYKYQGKELLSFNTSESLGNAVFLVDDTFDPSKINNLCSWKIDNSYIIVWSIPEMKKYVLSRHKLSKRENAELNRDELLSDACLITLDQICKVDYIIVSKDSLRLINQNYWGRNSFH